MASFPWPFVHLHGRRDGFVGNRLLCAHGGVGSRGKLCQRQDGAILESGQDFCQVLARGNAEYATALRDAKNGRDLGAGLFAAEMQPVAAAQGDRSHRVFRKIGREFEHRMIEKQRQLRTQRQRVVHSLARLALWQHRALHGAVVRGLP